MKNITIGMPSFIGLEHEYDQIELCKSLGLDFIELNMNIPYYSHENLKNIDYRAFAKDNIEITVHMPDEIDLGSSYEEVRQAYETVCIKAINSLPEETSVLNFHFAKGPVCTMPDRVIYIYNQYLTNYLDATRRSIDSILKATKNRNILICFENSYNFKYPHIQAAIDMIMKEYHPESVGLTYDFGHDVISDYTDKAVLEKHISRVNHIHLHDVIDNKDHKQLFTGSTDIKSAVELAQNNNCRVVIEVRTEDALKPSVDGLRKYLSNS